MLLLPEGSFFVSGFGQFSVKLGLANAAIIAKNWEKLLIKSKWIDWPSISNENLELLSIIGRLIVNIGR